MTNTLTTTPNVQALPFAQEIERDPTLVSEHTRRTYRAALERFEEWRDGRQFTVTLVEEYLVQLRRSGLAPVSQRFHLAVIRWWARRIAKLAHEYSSTEDARRISSLAADVTALKDPKGERVPAGRHLGNPEIEALLTACQADPKPAGRRDAAIIAVVHATGARIHEVRDLTLKDVTYTQEGADLRLHGKGDKDRTGYIYAGPLLDAFNAWLDLRGVDPGPCFNWIHKDGKPVTGAHLSLEGLRQILRRRQLEAGIEKHMTWHDFRRTFIGRLLDTTDIVTAQELAGHASPNTTARYDRRSDRNKRDAARIVSNLTYGKE